MKRLLKIAAGALLTLGGVFWFFPVLGFWMLPLGLGILGSEIPAVREFNIRLKRWAMRKMGRLK